LGGVARALLLPFSVSASLLFYLASRPIDRLDRQDAIGWAAMCRTSHAPVIASPDPPIEVCEVG
jgi:hypothetical protein